MNGRTAPHPVGPRGGRAGSCEIFHKRARPRVRGADRTRATTLDHRHDEDTVYVGCARYVPLGQQLAPAQRHPPGRSTGLLRTVGWLVRRLASVAAVPDGTLTWQPHASAPWCIE